MDPIVKVANGTFGVSATTTKPAIATNETAASATKAGKASASAGESAKTDVNTGDVDEEDALFDFSGYSTNTRMLAAIVVCGLIGPQAREFYARADSMARYQLSSPQIMYKLNGKLIDDYREAYWWLRDNTAKDARVMAWWDYGYQIAGIAERTTIADGNTWNQDHIGMLGLCLTSPVPEVRCSFLDMNSHSRMTLIPTPARLLA
jgi:dolichyl-diphosphooligosaccharide--protein glycosyltransferase